MEKENKNKKKKVCKGLLKKSLIAAGSATVAATAVISVVACGTNEKNPEKGGVPVGTSKDGTKGVEIETKDDHDKSLPDNEPKKGVSGETVQKHAPSPGQTLINQINEETINSHITADPSRLPSTFTSLSGSKINDNVDYSLRIMRDTDETGSIDWKVTVTLKNDPTIRRTFSGKKSGYLTTAQAKVIDARKQAQEASRLSVHHITSQNVKQLTVFNAATKTLTIKPGVTQIDDNVIASAFGVNAIHILNLPNSLTQISSHTFNTLKLWEIHLGRGLTSIPSGAFESAILPKISIPQSVTKIGASPFKNSTKIRYRFPDMSLDQFKKMSIDPSAFNHCEIASIANNLIQNYIATNFIQTYHNMFADFRTQPHAWAATDNPANGQELNEQNVKRFTSFDPGWSTLYIKEGITSVSPTALRQAFAFSNWNPQYVILPPSLKGIDYNTLHHAITSDDRRIRIIET